MPCCFGITGCELPKPLVSEDVETVFESNIPTRVVFSPERQKGVRSHEHLAIDPLGQMHSQEGVRRIRYRIHQAVENIAVLWCKLCVLTKERNDRRVLGAPG